MQGSGGGAAGLVCRGLQSKGCFASGGGRMLFGVDQGHVVIQCGVTWGMRMLILSKRALHRSHGLGWGIQLVAVELGVLKKASIVQASELKQPCIRDL